MTPSSPRPEKDGGDANMPAVAGVIFGERLALAERYAAILADTGAAHGLIGPREVSRLWERHLLNCAVVHEAIPHDASVIDVGSGAGLPGLVLAIVRPDLQLHLVEPMLRRTTWLEDAVRGLELTNVTVHRARAEQLWGELAAPVVTARAVAPLAELARWCLPLVEAGGVMLALKGSSAPDELARDQEAVRRLGSVDEAIDTHGDGLLDPVTTVIRLHVDQPVRPEREVSTPEGRRTRRSGRRPSRRSRR
jgi:16S rRNA (guanine527-N7)-methyltransferase